MTDTIPLSPAAKQLLPAVDALSEKDKEGLARYILAALDGPADDPAEVRAAWKAVILRRVEEIKSGKVEGIPADEVDRRMREKYP
jgi:putative addiction module component (TIGR02574 family)